MKLGVLSLISRRAGGLFYSVRWLTQALQQQGCEATVFSARDAFSDEDGPLWDPVDVRLYKSFGPLQSSFQSRTMLAEASLDLVHLHGIWLDRQWASLHWQKRTGGPVVISPRGMLDPWAVGNSAWKKKLAATLFARESLDRASCIHALCRSEVESIRAYGLRNPICCIPNGVQLPELGMAMPERSSGRKKLLFLGRIHPKKGIAELLKAWAQVSAEARMDWKLMVAGWDDGGHEDGLKRAAREWGMSDSVEFLGPRYGAEKDVLMRSVDAFILPSFSEGLPMSVLEAWSYGLPVLMTEFCNIPEGFSADAAIRIEPETKAIASGLEQLFEASAEELQAIGRRGRKLVEEKFTWGKIASNMKAVYEWCLGGGNAPGCVIGK